MAGMTVRSDLRGATSLVRTLGLKESSYDRILDFFHSKALNLEVVTRTWVTLLLKIHPAIFPVNGRLLLVRDGIKSPKLVDQVLGGRSGLSRIQFPIFLLTA
jgi:hypothetical protein